jgi:hypothetical protein
MLGSSFRNCGLGAVALLVVGACGSGDDSTFTEGAGGDGGDEGGLLGGDGGLGTFRGDGSIDPEVLAACAADSQQAKQLPLDLYLMLDTSGSMIDTVSGNTTKWAAVKAALGSFVNDPGSAGIGVGLQYFPIPKPNVPATCSSNAECGAGGPCGLTICTVPGPNNEAVPCNGASDCPGANNACVPFGRCSGNINYVCTNINGSCGANFGKCNATAHYCENPDTCVASEYATPAVPIASLPGAAGAITTSLNQHGPNGLTPTSGALQGAVDEAKTYATANAGHTVVVVLATDGLPTECDQNIANISGIAAAAAGGSPAVKTFVIGVFTSTEAATAQANLDQIAAGGGTGKSFIINTSQNVEQQFLAALNQIRGSALPCEYTLPIPESGTPDYGKVNVEYTAGNGTKSVIPYVKAAGNCGPQGGWYYDADPANGGKPTKVEMCPATCAMLKSDPKGRIDVLQGCSTVTIVK